MAERGENGMFVRVGFASFQEGKGRERNLKYVWDLGPVGSNPMASVYSLMAGPHSFFLK